MTILALFILLIAGYMIVMKNICIQSIEEKLQESENLLKMSFKGSGRKAAETDLVISP